MGIEPSTCILRNPDAQFSAKSSKTLPRRSCNMMNKENDDFIPTHMERSAQNEQEMIIPPLQNAPRPTTLPTRGAAHRARKVELGLFKEQGSHERTALDINGGDVNNPALNNRFVGSNISPCESPSYVTNTSSYKFPELKTPEGMDLNPLPVPPKEGKKHIQANPKRHVRKYPLIIPANGVQRTLNKVMSEEDNQTILKTPNARNITAVPTIKPFSINKHPSNMAEYENAPKFESNNAAERTYQNVDTDDTASLQFESILEADVNKDQVLQSPDVTDGFYNFSIQKDHYHKSKEVDFDAQQLPGVNEDELRNLDIDKSMVKLNKQAGENKKSNESLDVKNATPKPTPTSTPPPPPTSAPPEENSGTETPLSSELHLDAVDKISIASCSNMATTSTHFPLSLTHHNPERFLKSKSLSPKQDNELAGNALFQKVRESVDKAMVSKNVETSLSHVVIKPLTEAELFSAAVNRLNDSNSVSCEDLLEFSDKKPKGHERGVDSDEVRIMMKVLGKDSSPERCLKSLEFIEWDVHKAIKIIKLQNILKDIELSLPETVEYLLKYDWDLHTTARRLKSLKT